MRRGSLALGLAVLLAACGARDEGGGSPPAAADAETRVEVVLWPQGRDGEALEAHLTCDPPGGSHPHPDAACSVIAGKAGAQALDPVAPDVVCTQIYGGPEEAEVVGVVGGREVSAHFSRQNGCEIARWDAVAPLVDLRSA